MSVFSKAQSFDGFNGDTEVAIRRLFYVCCFTFFSRRSAVLIKVILYVVGCVVRGAFD